MVDPELIAKVAGPVLSLVAGALVKRITDARSRLVSFLGHASAFTLSDEARTQVHTHSIVVRNAGRKSANNVRLTHGVLPPSVTVHPPIQYSIERNPEGSGEIVFPVLVPKEQVTISYLYFAPLTWVQVNGSTKSDEGFAKIITVIPTPQASKLVIALVWFLAFIGASLLFYGLVRMVLSVI